MVELLLGWMLLGLIPAAIAHARGLPIITWWLYGVLLFPVALVHVFFAKPDSVTIARRVVERKCPACAEVVQPDAKVCKHCHRDLPAPAEPAPPPRPREWRPGNEISIPVMLVVLLLAAAAGGALAWFLAGP
jgi:hypothetical protein